MTVRRDGSFVVFTLPHSEEEFRLPAAEARHLGTELLNTAWQIDEGRLFARLPVHDEPPVSLAVPDVVWQPRAGWSGDGNI